jgi:ribosomal protein S18 acetylase RimI-like enzyme
MRVRFLRVYKNQTSIIQKILRQAHKQNKKLGFDFPAYSFTKKQLTFFIKRDQYYALSIDGDFVGTVALKRRRTYKEIGSLAVLPKHQKHGWGTALLRFAESKLIKMGRRRAVLYTPKKHSALIKYYKKQGYRINRNGIKNKKNWTRLEKQLTSQQ